MQTRIVASPRAQQVPPVVISYPFTAVLLAAGSSANAVLQLVRTVSRSGKPLLSICHSRLTASAEQNNIVSNCSAAKAAVSFGAVGLLTVVAYISSPQQHVKKLIPHSVTALAPVQVANGGKSRLALPHAARQV